MSLLTHWDGFAVGAIVAGISALIAELLLKPVLCLSFARKQPIDSMQPGQLVGWRAVMRFAPILLHVVSCMCGPRVAYHISVHGLLQLLTR